MIIAAVRASSDTKSIIYEVNELKSQLFC